VNRTTSNPIGRSGADQPAFKAGYRGLVESGESNFSVKTEMSPTIAPTAPV